MLRLPSLYDSSVKGTNTELGLPNSVFVIDITYRSVTLRLRFRPSCGECALASLALPRLVQPRWPLLRLLAPRPSCGECALASLVLPRLVQPRWPLLRLLAPRPS